MKRVALILLFVAACTPAPIAPGTVGYINSRTRITPAGMSKKSFDKIHHAFNEQNYDAVDRLVISDGMYLKKCARATVTGNAREDVQVYVAGEQVWIDRAWLKKRCA